METTNIKKRKGKIVFSRELFNDFIDNGYLFQVFKDFIPADIDHIYHSNTIEMYGYSPFFEEVEMWIIPPTYILEIKEHVQEDESITYTHEFIKETNQ